MIQGVDGLVSGLPTSELVDSMIEASRGSARQMERQRDRLQVRLDTVLTYNLRLLSSKLDLSSLRQQASFQKTSLNSSSDAVSGTSTSSAQTGTTTLSVLQLAQAHQVSTTGSASASLDQGAGSITLQVGNGQQETITLGASASSLNDVADAINEADVGISASVINDGSGTSPFRIVLRSEQTGADNTITASGTGAFATLFDQATFTELTNAQDARVSLGTSGSLTVDSSDNTFDDLIPGTKLTVSEVASNVTVTVGRDTGGAQADIEEFFASLNSAIAFLNEHTDFDPDTGEAGVLLGQSDLRLDMNRLVGDLISPVAGLPSSRNTLTSIGISLDAREGTFAVDSGRLTAALTADPDGVMKLFANSGDSSDPDVAFLGLTAATDLSSPFTVDITQAAEQAVVVGNAVASDSIAITTGSNDVLQLDVNGQDIELTLASGTYTRAELADHVGQLLDDAIAGGIDVGVSVTTGNEFEFRSSTYGSTQTITVKAGAGSTAASTLGFLTAITDNGQDVAGTINGIAATGAGKVLTGIEGTATEGLRLRVDSEAPVSGITVTGRKGIAQRVHERLESFTDPVNGSITNKENSISARMTDLDERIDKIDERLEIRRATLLAEFRTMETIISQFQSQQTFLTSQLDAIRGINNSRQGNR